MAEKIKIFNLTHSLSSPITALHCSSFLCRFRGLMMKKSLQTDEGLLLVEEKESRINASIHMYFMNFNIAVVWIDGYKKVVDVRLAKKWRSVIWPIAPAQYILELNENRLQDFQIGDHLKFEQV